jgi:hypothetical protein
MEPTALCVAGEDLVPEPQEQVQEDDEGGTTGCFSTR